MRIYKKMVSVIISVIFTATLLSGCGISFDIGFENMVIETKTIVQEDYDISIDVKEIEISLDYFIENLNIIEEQTESEVLDAFENNSNLVMKYIYLAKETGQFYLHPFVEMPEDYDVRARPWYIQAMKEEIYISEIYEDVATGEQIITIAKKIVIDSKLYGVIGIDVVVDKN
ncbi:hypothetical protein Amet_3358 [Alkaliphilus metalliredigens QYMF]|uniref:Uncharacterized protein n=1 Tax=Alkaliphilus metalliredigens (strain QYMF) TaxID=293826 RepID=A6TTG8_ALKMQ|nr:cache domain-containing protein [Alkaliphilus metalliredigens]ABR49486.1 hypothetical protein Amet_3358 [Alkaliphilus metalliredigens QYMF]